MYISSRVHLLKNWYKVVVCIYYHQYNCRKIDIKFRYVHIIRCSSAEKLILSFGMYISSGVHLQESWYKVAVYIYHQVFMCRKVDIKLRYVYILSRVHLQESWYKVAVCIYHHVFICWKINIKLRYVYIIRCLSAGKLI